MRVIYYQSPTGNFGDDLNAILWREVLPDWCFEADDAILLGIGSIFREDFLSERITRNKRVFVLGSGAGTGPLPRHWPNPNWSLLAVRGPLTGRLVERPQAAVTDGATLLAIADRLRPTRQSPGDIVFFPHYNSVPFSRWREACDLAGVVFANPHRPPGEILRILGRARLVIAEAMHGAIVADTLRIPWIPVVSSPAILPFKWVDWTRSLELDYRPIDLPPSSGWEALKHFRIRVDDPRHARQRLPSQDHDALIEDFHRRFGNVAVEELIVKPRLNGALRSAVQKTAASFDRIFVERAAEALRRIANGRTYLSDERILASRVEQLQEAVTRLRRALSA